MQEVARKFSIGVRSPQRTSEKTCSSPLNSARQANAMRRKRTVLFISETSGYVIDLKYAGVHDHAKRYGWNLVRLNGRFATAGTFTSFWHPHGVITDKTAFIRPGIPSVLLDGDAPPDMPCHRIDVNLAESAHLAGAEFLRLGIQNLAWIPPFEEHLWSIRRRNDFEAFAKERGMSVMCFPSATYRRGKYACYIQELGAWAESLPCPCGVFAANDATAEDFLGICAMRGIKVPHDLAVIGVDDNPVQCEATTPTLTSITPPFRESGIAAAEMLATLMSGQKCQNRILGVTGMSRRESTQRNYGRMTDIQRARNLIRERACLGLRPREVFEVMNGSVRNAQIRFRAETGRSVRDEIERIRLGRAQRLLRTTNKSVAEIAALCGYATDSFLCERFRCTMGCTMGEWRKRNSN